MYFYMTAPASTVHSVSSPFLIPAGTRVIARIIALAQQGVDSLDADKQRETEQLAEQIQKHYERANGTATYSARHLRLSARICGDLRASESPR